MDLESIRVAENPRVIYTELTVTPGNLLLSKLTFCHVSFVSQKNRGRDGEGWKEERTTRKSRGIFRRTPGKEMKISNGLCLLVEPARKGSGYGGNVARKTLAYIFLRFEIARLESKFEISTVPKSTRNSE